MNVDCVQDAPYHTPDELPEKYRKIFNSYPNFNAVQSAVFDDIFRSNRSVVVAAPTGSGKTVVLELAIAKVLIDLEKTEFQNDFKMIYVSPVKALCRERFNDWSPRFATVGISCAEVTGDVDDYFDLRGYNIIITTPEKWDSLTRRWRDNAALVQLVKLFMIDEVHLLSDNKRGPVLEAIVCRMKTVSKTLRLDCVRFVAVSATISNVEDLAYWLGDKDGPASYRKFGSEVRPVKLQKIVRGYPAPSSQRAFFFDIQLSYKLKSLILEYSKGKPTLIFCSTRKSVIQTTKLLSEQLTFHLSESEANRLREGCASIADNKLKDLVMCGMGYHHAGMGSGDRHAVEALFMAGHLPILVATSTLAMGVNLPAHLVIIKSTQQFIAGQVVEYSESAILQMIGRAGRPQFDTSATAIIMTRNDLVQKYENILESKEIIESSLHLHLPEHLNSEIVLFTITDLAVAMDWIRSTYLYVRAIKNPRHYGFGTNNSTYRIEKCLETMCLKEIHGLRRAELITVNDNGMDIAPTFYGRLMSHYYLSFETFKIFLNMKGSESMPQVLASLSDAQEFSDIQLRMSERKVLNDLNKGKNRDTIRYPLQGKIKNRSMKVNCLIQSCLGCLVIQDPGLQSEGVRIVRLAERLCKCLLDILSKRKHYETLLNVALLAKCLHARLWENTPFVSRQLERIGPTSGSLLASCGKTTFQSIEESNPRDLERILGRAPPFGNVLQEAVRHLPKYGIRLENERLNTLSYRTIVTVTLLNADVINERNTAGSRHWVSLIVGDSDNNLLHFARVTDQTLVHKDLEVSVVTSYPNLPHKVLADVVSDLWVGIDVASEILVVGIAGTKLDVKGKGPALAVEVKRASETVGKLTEDKDVYDGRNTGWECCFDVDVVIEDDEEESVPGPEATCLPVPPRPRKLLMTESVFNLPAISGDTPDIPFESVDEIYEHFKGFTTPNSSRDEVGSLDSGYASSVARGSRVRDGPEGTVIRHRI